MAEYLIGSPLGRRRIGILPSAFNPPTVAHLALAAAAEHHARLDQIVFALPRKLPHKSFTGASLEQRTEMLRVAIAVEPRRAAAYTTGGLFVEIAREFAQIAAADAEIFLICGRDAAERIADWDYGQGPTFAEQLREFQLIVGDREGSYQPPTELRQQVLSIALPLDMDRVSSEVLRSKRAAGESWQLFTEPRVAQLIEGWNLYR